MVSIPDGDIIRKELLVYVNEYCLGVSVTCADTTMVEAYTRQVAEMMVKALQPE